MITDKIKSDKDNTDEDIDLLMDQPVTLAKCNKLLETLGIGVSVYHIRKNRGYDSNYRVTIKFEDSILPLNTIYSLNAIGKNNNCGGVVFGLLLEVYSRINKLLFDIESSPEMSDDNLFNKFVYAKLLQRKIERCSLENLGTSLNERFLCNFITNVCSDIDREVSGLNGFISRIVLTGFGIFLTLKSSDGNGRIMNVLVYIPKGLFVGKDNMINYTWFYKTLLRPSFFNDRELNNDANKGAITTIIEKNKQIMLQNISSAEFNVKKWFDDIVDDIREKSIA